MGCGKVLQKSILIFLKISLFLLFLINQSCTQAPEPPLRIGSNVWPGYEPLYLARELGFYQSAPIRLVELASATDVIHAMRSGTLEAAALTLDEVLTLLDQGIGLKLILVFDFSHGADALIAKSTIAELPSLRNKRIAVENTAMGALLLDSALSAGGLTVADVEIMSCNVDLHSQCFETVDALVTFEPTRTKLVNQGARVLFDSSQIPGRIVDVLAVRDFALEQHKNALRQLVSGYFKARQFMQRSKSESANILARRLNVEPAAVFGLYQGILLPDAAEIRHLLTPGNESLEVTVNELADFMLARNLIKNRVDYSGLVDAQFLPEIAE